MKQPPRVVTLTLHAAIDRVVEIDSIQPGGTFEGRTRFTVPAGKGVNTARVLSALTAQKNSRRRGDLGGRKRGLLFQNTIARTRWHRMRRMFARSADTLRAHVSRSRRARDSYQRINARAKRGRRKSAAPFLEKDSPLGRPDRGLRIGTGGAHRRQHCAPFFKLRAIAALVRSAIRTVRCLTSRRNPTSTSSNAMRRKRAHCSGWARRST